MVLIKQRRLRLFAMACLLVLLVALFVGGHQPGSGRLFPAPWDKLAHLAYYSTLTIVTGIAFPKMQLPLLGLVIIAIGSADETHQIFVPGRHPGLDDLAADAIGCLPTLFLVSWLRKALDVFLK